MKQNRDLLDRLKAEKERKHLTYQDIVDLTEQNGETVSMTTVRRVFSKDAQLENFRYHQTVAPIARALLDSKEESTEEEGTEAAHSDEVNHFRTELETLKQHETNIMEQAKEEMQTKIDDCIGNLRKERTAVTKWYQRAILLLVILICISLILDLACGSIGLIRY